MQFACRSLPFYVAQQQELSSLADRCSLQDSKSEKPGSAARRDSARSSSADVRTELWG
jgi:hypothetical protein